MSMASMLLYIHKASLFFLHYLIIQGILSYLLLGYEDRVQDICIEKVFYFIIYSYNCLAHTTISLLSIKVGITKYYLAFLYK